MKIIYHFMIFIIYLHLAGCMWFSVIEGTYRKTLDHSLWCQNIESAYECVKFNSCVYPEDSNQLGYFDLSEDEIYYKL